MGLELILFKCLQILWTSKLKKTQELIVVLELSGIFST